MIIIECEQGSPEWWQARCGIPTASEFDKIITPARLEPSRQSDGYMHKLLAEWLRGQPDQSFQSDWMKRGTEMEAQAREAYAFIHDADPGPVGFCTTDDGRLGCSPDALLDDGGLEIKCPSAGVHAGYLIDNRLPTAYRAQVLGALWITGRAWWDFLSFYPDMPPLIVRTHRDQNLDALADVGANLLTFIKRFDDMKAHLLARGFKPQKETA